MYTTESHVLSAECLTLQLARCPFHLIFVHVRYIEKVIQTPVIQQAFSKCRFTPGLLELIMKKVHRANIIYSHQNVE